MDISATVNKTDHYNSADVGVVSAYLHTQATSNAQRLRYGGDLVLRRDLNTQLAWGEGDTHKPLSHVEPSTSLTHPVHRTRLATLLTAFLGLTTVCADNGYSSEFLVVLAPGTRHLGAKDGSARGARNRHVQKVGASNI